jgi:hypothetical protein
LNGESRVDVTRAESSLRRRRNRHTSGHS